MRRTCITLFFVGALVLTACGGSDDTTSATRPAQTSAADTGTEAPADEDEDAGVDGATDADGTVVLVQAGAEPRQELRLHPEVGARQELTIRQEMEIEQDGGGGASFSTHTVTENDLDVEVTAAGETIEAVSTYVDVRLVEAEPFGVRGQIEDVLDQLRGQSITITMSPRGEIVESEVLDVDSGMPTVDEMLGSLQSQADQMAVPFPEEAVGIGAVWERSSTLDMPMGMSMTTTTTFTLIEIDGDHVRARQETRMTMAGSGSTEVDGELTGVGFVDWGLAAPTSTSSMQVSGTMTISVGGMEIEQTQRQVINVTAR